ncbi:MAG: hypothetical protein WCL13_03740, partial [bacterium]
MPNGLSEVKLGPDWSAVRITAADGTEKVPFRVTGGKLKKLFTSHRVDDNRFKLINRQVQAIYADYEKRARLARQLKKHNWSFYLEKCGVIIEKDGRLKISRWIPKKNGQRERIWQALPDIKSAIRQQDHILHEYFKKKIDLKNDEEVFPKLACALNKLKIIQPYIEIRRAILIQAQAQMEVAIFRTIKGFEVILSAKGMEREKCHGLTEKLERLKFFLKNDWPSPYRGKIDQIMPLLKEAKKSAVNLNWRKVESLLLSAKEILTSVTETSNGQSSLVSISEIDPIRILAEVNKYGLA